MPYIVASYVTDDNTSGWREYSDGMLYQWGFSAVSGTGSYDLKETTFLRPFANNLYCLQLTSLIGIGNFSSTATCTQQLAAAYSGGIYDVGKTASSFKTVNMYRKAYYAFGKAA